MIFLIIYIDFGFLLLLVFTLVILYVYIIENNKSKTKHNNYIKTLKETLNFENQKLNNQLDFMNKTKTNDTNALLGILQKQVVVLQNISEII
jgi:uncharacterized membrane protein